MPFSTRIWMMFVQCFFRDPARPLEWLNLLALLGYAHFMLTVPGLFDRPAYAGFDGGPVTWALAMITVALAQLAAMWPALRPGPILRFLAMAAATGFWTFLAISFSQGDQSSSVTRLYGVIAFIVGLTGIYLGLVSKRD